MWLAENFALATIELRKFVALLLETLVMMGTELKHPGMLDMLAKDSVKDTLVLVERVAAEERSKVEQKDVYILINNFSSSFLPSFSNGNFDC